MSEDLSRSFEVTGSGSASRSVLTYQKWSDQRAYMQGLKWGGMCWGVALCALPIPIIHFVAVPAGVLAGPLVAYLVAKLYRGSCDVTSGQVLCPKCGANNTGQVKVEQPLQSFNCNGCASVIELKQI